MDIYKYLHYLKVFVTNPRDTVKRMNGSIVSAEKYVTVSDTFIKQEYYWLVEHLSDNTTVIDIGAHIGDTAIYFAQFDKVRSVIAYEPTPVSYRNARENVDGLPKELRNKIVLKNMAIGDDEVKIISEGVGSHVMNFHTVRSSKDGVPIESETLQKALKGLVNVVIKCDCEGGEYDIFDDHLDLSNVYAIQMEYHFGADRIVNVLKKKGFRTSSKSTFRKAIGYIYAYRPIKSKNKNRWPKGLSYFNRLSRQYK